MKKAAVFAFLLFLTAAGISLASNKPALKSGSLQIGGKFTFFLNQSMTENSEPVLGMGLGVNLGYFITQTSIVGLWINADALVQFGEDFTHSHANINLIGLYFRYLSSFEEAVNLFFGFGAGYGITVVTGPSVPSDDTIQRQSLAVNVSIGIMIPLSRAVAIEVQLVPTVNMPLTETGNIFIHMPLHAGVIAFLY